MPAKTAILALCLLAATPLAAAPAGQGAQPEWWRDGGPRLRATDARAAAALRNGLDRSPTLRALVERIDKSDVVVYLAMRPDMAPDQAGGLTLIGNAGGFRYMRVSLNAVLGSDLLIATLGHELQHVVEVIEHPEVIDEASMVALYRRIGQPSRILRGFGWETVAAQTAGTDVRRELVAKPVTTVAETRKPTER